MANEKRGYELFVVGLVEMSKRVVDVRQAFDTRGWE